MGTRAVIYARISDARGEDTAGVDRQIADCIQLCHERDWTVVTTYIDNSISAFAAKPRPEFEAMMNAASDGTFDVIVCWAADRLYRRIADLETLVDKLGSIPVATVQSGRVDLTTADGRMTARILGSVAQHESEKKGERISRAYQQRAEAGRYGGGMRRIGYTADAKELVAEEADLIRQAYFDILDGKSMHSIQREWTEAGMRTSTGKPFVSYTLRKILLRPMNAGHGHYKGQIFEGASTSPAIIDPETWAAVKAILEDPSRQPHNGRPPKKLLSGIARCGVCGGPIRSSQKASVGVYRCYDHACVSRRRPAVDELITRTLFAHLEANHDQILDGLSHREPVTLIDASTDVAEASRIRRELAALPELLAAGDLTAGDYAAATSRLRERLAAVEAAISATSRGPSPTVALITSDDVPGTWAQLDVTEQRSILKELIDHIRIDRVPPKGDGLSYIETVWRDLG